MHQERRGVGCSRPAGTPKPGIVHPIFCGQPWVIWCPNWVQIGSRRKTHSFSHDSVINGRVMAMGFSNWDTASWAKSIDYVYQCIVFNRLGRSLTREWLTSYLMTPDFRLETNSLPKFARRTRQSRIPSPPKAHARDRGGNYESNPQHQPSTWFITYYQIIELTETIILMSYSSNSAYYCIRDGWKKRNSRPKRYKQTN